MTERLVWNGRLTTLARLRVRGALLIAPALAWLGALLFLPGAALLLIAFTRRDPDGRIVGEFSARAFERLAGYGVLGWSPDLLITLARTLAAAAGTTLICVALAYPVAFALARMPPACRESVQKSLPCADESRPPASRAASSRSPRPTGRMRRAARRLSA